MIFTANARVNIRVILGRGFLQKRSDCHMAREKHSFAGSVEKLVHHPRPEQARSVTALGRVFVIAGGITEFFYSSLADIFKRLAIKYQAFPARVFLVEIRKDSPGVLG